MRPVEPIDEPAEPIRACDAAARRIHACAVVAPVLDPALSAIVEATEPPDPVARSQI
jgi:hypothetical protein